MRHSSRLAMLIVPFLAMLGHANASSAQTAKPDPTLRDVLLRHWTDIGDKVVKMAEEFPEDKYEFRPVAGVRTFAENLRHVAFGHAPAATSGGFKRRRVKMRAPCRTSSCR